jgi:pyruvate dehydrogenase E2 component (dihydrolipoyllysine-residue acetyltransferase)
VADLAEFLLEAAEGPFFGRYRMVKARTQRRMSPQTLQAIKVELFEDVAWPPSCPRNLTKHVSRTRGAVDAMDVILPKVALTMGEAVIAEWHCRPGDQVTKGEPLFSIETDKVIAEIEAPADGILAEVFHEAGETVTAGSVVAQLDVAGEVSLLPPHAEVSVSIVPAAAELAEQLGIDVDTVRGTGSGGRILESDVLAAVEAGQGTTGSASSLSAATPPRSSPVVISRARAAGMALAEQSAGLPTFLLWGPLDFSAVYDRSRVAGLSVTDVLGIATARVLKAMPVCHSHWRHGHPEQYLAPRIGILARSGDALVPLVFADPSDLDATTFRQRRQELMDRLVAGRLRADDVASPTFVLSNLGRYNVTAFSAVLFPETAITMAIGTLGLAGPKALTAVLTCDHRLVDGVDAAEFHAAIQEAILTVRMTKEE